MENNKRKYILNIGYIEREVIYPIVTDNLLYCSQKFINTNSTKQILTTFKYSTIPIKTSIQSKGAILSLSPQHLNLSIGYLNRKLLSVEANSSFSMFYNNEDRQALQVCAVIKPKIQGEQHD